MRGVYPEGWGQVSKKTVIGSCVGECASVAVYNGGGGGGGGLALVTVAGWQDGDGGVCC